MKPDEIAADLIQRMAEAGWLSAAVQQNKGNVTSMRPQWSPQGHAVMLQMNGFFRSVERDSELTSIQLTLLRQFADAAAKLPPPPAPESPFEQFPTR